MVRHLRISDRGENPETLSILWDFLRIFLSKSFRRALAIKGEARAMSILGAYTASNVSAGSAAKSGGITKIASEDNKFTNILGVYATYCVVVTDE